MTYSGGFRNFDYHLKQYMYRNNLKITGSLKPHTPSRLEIGIDMAAITFFNIFV